MPNILTQLSDAVADIVTRNAPSIVRVDGARRAPATGIVWSDDLVVTAGHAVRTREGITVTGDDGQPRAATVVGGDGSTDVALLRIEKSGLRPIPWSERKPRAGEFMIVAGRPGHSVRAGVGVASAVGGEWRTSDGSPISFFLDVDASLPDGFSGGPLLDSEGACVGMNTSRVAPGGTTIPRATLQRVVDELLQHGAVRRPLIGVGVYPVEGGLLVMSVKEDSSAARAGILVGDIIRRIEGNEIRSPRALYGYLQNASVGQEVEIELTRGGEARTLRLSVGSA
jgi:S1-C subfamily serine protease